MYEIFAKLLKERGVTAYRVHKDTGISQTTLSDWKAGRITPKIDKLQAIADYFGVSLEYLRTGTEKKAPLTQRDERDIAKRLEAVLGDLGAAEGALMFDGEPLDEETQALLRASLQSQLEMTKRLAKQKFTPKKYRKE